METLAPAVQTIAMLVPSDYSASQPCWTNLRILRHEVKNTEDGGPGGPDFTKFSLIKDGYERCVCSRCGSFSALTLVNLRDYSWPEEST